MLDSVDLASCDFSGSRNFYRTGKLGVSLTCDCPHVHHCSADLSVVHRQCGTTANIDIITFAALNRASAHLSRSGSHPYTIPTVVFDGTAVHGEFRCTVTDCRDRDTIRIAVFDLARTVHAEAGCFSAGGIHFNACAFMCCAIFNRAAGRIHATAVGCMAVLDRATGHMECAVAHIHTCAVGCSKAADRAAGQRQCIVAVTCCSSRWNRRSRSRSRCPE